MKKFLFRSIPILVCCMVLVVPFSVSASSLSYDVYDFIGNASGFSMSVDYGPFQPIPNLSRNFSPVPNNVVFRIDVTKTALFDDFTVGFFLPSDVSIKSVYLQSPGATTSRNTARNTISDFVYYEYDIKWIADDDTRNDLIANGYIDLFVEFRSSSRSAFNFSVVTFYGYSGVKFPLTKSLINVHEDLTYFYAVGSQVTSGVDANVNDLNVGSWFIRSVPFNSSVDGHTVLGVYQDLITMVLGQSDLPIKKPGKLSFTVASYSDIDFSAYFYKADASGNEVKYLLPVEVIAGETYNSSDVSEKYAQLLYTVYIDTSVCDWSDGNYVEISMAVSDFERAVAQDYYFAFAVLNFYAHPFSSSANTEASFWYKIQSVLSSGFQSVVDAISSIFPGADSGEDFLEDATDKRNELDNAMNQIDSVQKPDISNSGDISNIVSPSVSTAYGNIFTSVIGNDYVVSILLLMGTFMLAGYVLFGKK